MVWMSSHANADRKKCLSPFDMRFKGIPPVLASWGFVPSVKSHKVNHV